MISEDAFLGATDPALTDKVKSFREDFYSTRIAIAARRSKLVLTNCAKIMILTMAKAPNIDRIAAELSFWNGAAFLPGIRNRLRKSAAPALRRPRLLSTRTGFSAILLWSSGWVGAGRPRGRHVGGAVALATAPLLGSRFTMI